MKVQMETTTTIRITKEELLSTFGAPPDAILINPTKDFAVIISWTTPGTVAQEPVRQTECTHGRHNCSECDWFNGYPSQYLQRK